MSSLPYTPTRVLPASSRDELIYVFQPASASGKGQLLAVNTSTKLENTQLPYSTITPDLPFLRDDSAAYIPVSDSNGNLLVYGGDCSKGSQGSSLWQIKNASTSLHGNGTWQELDLSTDATAQSQTLDGANHLAAGIAFSSVLDSTTSMYIFGGMCPNSTQLSSETWTGSSTYSNLMLSIAPKQPFASSATPSPSAFELSLPASRGPPVPEAGFTITPLNPTYSSSNDNVSQSQNQNFILLGGHTRLAFINMSQLALFSLPEQSWSFLPVDLPPGTPNTDLAVRDSNGIDSRSGHTAVLTSDGKRVIMFGGWVGDITQPADPQLAILELGQGYGGSGDWQWSIPSTSGPSLASGTGIYGHGAAMLDGDIMLITGGYNIPVPTDSKRKRQSPAINSQTYFLNTTSNAWVTSYEHPKIRTQSPAKENDDSNRAAKRVGLGVGLTFGILALIVAVVVFFWYSKRLKRKRDARNEELRRLAPGAQTLQLPMANDDLHHNSMSEVGVIDGSAGIHRPTSVGIPAFHREPEAERTGLLFEIPSPTRGLRRSLHSRGMYQPAPRYDNGRRTPDFISTIHPIDERDEYDEHLNGGSHSNEHDTIQRRDYDLLSNVPVLDPFQDPHGGSRSPSPQSPQQRAREVQRWVSDWTAADALMHQQGGRLSPEKTDRTSSTLSDQSAISMLSSSSFQASAGTVSRTMSQRSGGLFSLGPFRSTNDTTPFDMQGPSHQQNSPEHRRSRSLTLYSNTERRAETPTSFVTAKTSVAQPRPEGATALLGEDEGESSPTRMQSRARGLMGSLRRAFTGERSHSASPEHPQSTSSSPTKVGYTELSMPQRSASASGMLWRHRQGAKDWDAGGGTPAAGPAGKTGDEEWDVESAVANRVVQVMFTVPREKLRVVNAGPEGDGASILSAQEIAETTMMEGTQDSTAGGESKGKEKEK
ncbi:uncharacterized protein KY384_006852 [Bacidia gigantensis]|uniref:uncharacterized protein n=1 Tax=Bacidia gigantensis TaxID=2732470 RepID=UPI001D03F4AD|nr:uncharacterized protein KY384_006852 [Bacidia gigantensis]KAG8527936.1 hypothetical protein KY384_006852 [Bacidia gigantensis]